MLHAAQAGEHERRLLRKRIVGIGESVILPLAATEQVLRGAIDKVRRSTGL
jgi:hypothetical protein